jgi:hypothetical protein
MKMEQIKFFETPAQKIQMPGESPKRKKKYNNQNTVEV